MGAQLDADTAQHQKPQNDHQRQVEAAKTRRIKRRKSKKQRAAGSEQPNLVAVPDRTYGAQDHVPFVMSSCDKKADDPCAEVEAVEHDVSDDHQSDENEPKRFRIRLLEC